MATNPTVAVYGIYKNEEKFMERFLNSVKEADEIVLCDTGSSDDTDAIIEAFRQSNRNVPLKTYQISVSPWRFDDAFNAAMALVRADIDLCIALGIDEYLMAGWRDVLGARWDTKYTRYYHKFQTIWSKDRAASHWHDRIHVRRGYTWKLPVHEILEYKADESICWLDDFWIYHQPDTRKSRSSYLPMIEQSAKERPDVWKTWSFLANEYLVAGRLEEMGAALDTALALEDSDKGYLHLSKYHMYQRQNKQDLALFSLNNYISCMPARREPYFLKARYLHQLGRNAEAYFALKEAQKHVNEITDYKHNANAWGKPFDDFMSTVAALAKKEGEIL